MQGLVVMCLAVLAGAGPEEIVRFDFDTGDLQRWRVVEAQFDYVVSDRAKFRGLQGA
jgi:hypothetical protein